MEREKWLEEMRKRQFGQVEKGVFREIHQDVPDEYWIGFINGLKAEEMAESYLMCPNCGEMKIPLDRAMSLINEVGSTDQWLDACDELAEFLHRASAVPKASRKKLVEANL